MIVTRLNEADWRRSKTLRLRALQNAPDAFGSTYAEEMLMTDDAWQKRLSSARSVTFHVSLKKQDIGLVVGAPYDGENAAGLFAMWVDPAARGSGAGDLLIEAVKQWAKKSGYARLVLDVADDNDAAIALYERHGFVPTGHTDTLPPPRTHIKEHRRELIL